MRLTILAAAASAVSFFGVAPVTIACDGPPVCTIVDPTGTPLNVRSSPSGKVLSNLRNGSKVEVIDHVDRKGKRWARVSKFQEATYGWVFEAYLKCKPGVNAYSELCTVTDPTGTPLNVRETPGGDIVGSWINGVKVRGGMERQTYKGKSWVTVERLAEDNPVGWVYDPYLKCEEDE